MKLDNRHIEDLLRRCSAFPWGITMREDGIWEMRASDRGNTDFVCAELPDINNYDRRLWALSPMLALEVLQLRRETDRLKQDLAHAEKSKN